MRTVDVSTMAALGRYLDKRGLRLSTNFTRKRWHVQLRSLGGWYVEGTGRIFRVALADAVQKAEDFANNLLGR